MFLIRVTVVDIGKKRRMYFEDSPIKTQAEDLLNRKNFAKKLGASILNTEVKEGCCIGLFGPWGSGKTSVVNMVLEEIDRLSEVQENKPLIVKFNPWNYSSKEQLLSQYFVTLAGVFSDRSDKTREAISKEIEKYSNIIGDFGYPGKFAKMGGYLFSRGLLHNNLYASEDLSKQRDNLIKALEEQNQRVIVVIDDIDRLSNDEIKTIFQLVTSVAKFPNVIYMLSFDKQIVARALSEVQRYDGDKYLEKIIQVPIEIPNVSNDCLWNILFMHLDNLMERYEDITFEGDYWPIIFNEIVAKYICSVRDVMRLINVLNVKCNMIGEELNMVDLIALTSIEIKLPTLYEWIKNNKEDLVGGERATFSYYGMKPEEIKKAHFEELKRLDAFNATIYSKILCVLFPYYKSKEIFDHYSDDKNMLLMRRIGHPLVFDKYFSLELNTNEIAKGDFNRAINELTEGELIQYLSYINDNNCMMSFLQNLSAAGEVINEDRISTIVKSLVKISGNATGIQNSTLFSMPAASLIEYRIIDLIKRINDKEKERLLIDIIDEADISSIQLLSNLINRFELSYGRFAGKGKERGEKVITLETLLECEKHFSIKIRETLNENNVLDLEQAGLVIYVYQSLLPEECNEYVRKLLNNDLNKVKYITLYAEKWTGGGTHWRYNDKYKEYLSQEDAVSAVDTCINDESLWDLDEEKQHRAIAFKMWIEKEFDMMDEISDKKVQQKIDDLKAVI